MKIPVIRGVIDRRVLVNYRVDPDVLAPLLPAPFRPKTIHGVGMVGICLIRLKQVRPRYLPAWLGLGSENAAHRVAVEWDENGRTREGVFVRRRDSSSWMNHLAGGWLFPGIHHHARFTVAEMPDRLDIAMRSDDGSTSVCVRVRQDDRLPSTSVFRSMEEASRFFENGSLGYSTTPDVSRFQGLELRCHRWKAEPLAIEAAHSSFFDDVSLFPNGSIELDCALLMRGIEHEWHAWPDMCAACKDLPLDRPGSVAKGSQFFTCG